MHVNADGSTRPHSGLLEAALLASLFAAYELLRAVGRADVGGAVERGHGIFRWQSQLGLPSEAGVQNAILSHEGLVAAANNYYVWVHFPATALFLVWLWRRHHGRYVYFRSLLVSLTALGLVLHALVPVAPPRLLPGTSFVDTMAAIGPSAYGEGPAAALANQYAAFPSLHVGWALLVAYGAVRSSARGGRWVVVLHPVLTLAVVVMTANHYWLDAAAAAGLLGVAVAVPPALRAACQRLRGNACRLVPA